VEGQLLNRVRWRALDGSGWELLSDGTRMVDSAGVRCIGGTRTDRNGNQIVVSSRVLTDTLGRQIPITMVSNGDTAGCTGSLPIASAYLWSPQDWVGEP